MGQGSSTRIAFLCLSPHAGGMELDALRMAVRVKQSYPTIFICRQNTFILEKAQQEDVDVRVVAGVQWLANKFISPHLVFGLREILRANKVNHLVFFGTSECRSIFLALVGLPVKFVLRHGTTVSKSKRGRPWREFGYKRVDTFLANSIHIAKNVSDFFPIRQNAEVRVVYPVIKFNEEESIAQSGGKGKVKIIYHSRFAPGKGHMDALKACMELRKYEENFEYEMIGHFSDVKCVESLQEFIRENNLSANCRLTSFDQNVEKKLSCASIFLGPSHGEGFSNSFVEALGKGLVCVVYDNTVYPECKKMGFHFHMARNLDVQDLSIMLLECVRNLQREMTLSTDNVLLAKRQFSPSREMRELSDIFSREPV